MCTTYLKMLPSKSNPQQGKEWQTQWSHRFTSSLYETGGLLGMCHFLQNSAWCSPNKSHMESFACQVLLVLPLKQKINRILKIISVLKLHFCCSDSYNQIIWKKEAPHQVQCICSLLEKSRQQNAFYSSASNSIRESALQFLN